MEVIQSAPNGVGDSGIPSGCILMWSGSIDTIPNGWKLCDGSNDTPDLRNRFIVGAGESYSPGDTGGSNTVALTISQIPSHSHSGSATVTIPELANTGEWKVKGYLTGHGTSIASSSVSGNITTNNNGGGLSHENRPPYYALCFIMKR